MEDDLQRTVGRNLRAYRIKRGLSQEAFAATLAVDRTDMGGLERGELNLTLKSVERIAAEVEDRATRPAALANPTACEPRDKAADTAATGNGRQGRSGIDHHPLRCSATGGPGARSVPEEMGLASVPSAFIKYT